MHFTICFPISKIMQVIAIDHSTTKTTNTTRMFPDMLGVGGFIYSPPNMIPVLLIKFGHHSSKPLVDIQENCLRIDDGTYKFLY